ncbi:MAG: M23 family metallopeptidase [Gemmatimonadetes bacterium]|nr:M23 family metallopeptidase [Gemmatimonadota bacterium]MYA64222.1 M23 family metallopeptidase [Gemmatimonadota bacterium]MYC00145.1 M23 family metallopeptidase [Gemmatimonadota bacterium]MYH53060.1 M23 family metallopeptidase [Gemmatimonadota bacterium]MYI44929.1 M23 family metallopeptidase [Gemmatimonadota bacterium]
MSDRDGGLSLIVVPDSGGEPRSVSLSRRQARVLGVMGSILGIAIAVMAVSWVSMARRAARSDNLAHQVDSLIAHQTRIEHVAERLAQIEGRQDTYRVLLGLGGSADSAFWVPAPSGTGRASETLTAGGAGTEPTAWPLTVPGVVTQAHLGGAGADHPGIDIAVASGSYVRAAGDGIVVEAALDSVYGLFILIDHGNGTRTRYGHALYLISQRGWTVRQGEVIALSGSTGASTAPHLHFEIEKHGEPVDPLSMVTPP